MNNAINFEKPVIGADPNKPASLSNQSFPYNYIANPRRFEELLYSIFELQIRSREISDFDDVNLMIGVRDQGRDCTLMRNGKCYGLIQCKKYERNYSKDDFGLEIVRFILYSLIDDRLITDKNDFTYYIVVSNGFTSDCGKFIDDFSNNILNEPKLEEWINKNLELPSLAVLKPTFNQSDFKSLISGLKVKKMVPQDLDISLNSPSCKELVPLFFEVRTVTDNSKVEELIDRLQNNLTQDELLDQLKIGSARLQSERNTFQDIENSHIERIETVQLYNWIIETPEKKDGILRNICLLAGQAGYGKTVVLKDLYTKCLDDGVVVLGLKADKLYSNTLKGLQDTLGFTLPVHEIIKECKKHFSRIIILIDQIDALSQSMSSDRSYLELYRTIIDYYSKDENIKFIISVRTSDLQYDPSLKIYKNTKTIQLGLLEQSKVLELLAKIDIVKDDLSPKLLELLRVPNHLNIFSQIVSNRSILKATNVLELYLELWRQKVAEIGATIPAQKVRIKELLYAIAKQMFNDQRITVSELRYENYSEEIRYLESERLIKVEDRQIQFFHQSFYDFVFAKQFVEGNESLLDYIKNGEQSIHIRSAVKMIISYLRESDPAHYTKDINAIFFNDQIFFHIKHILMVSLAAQEKPTNEEKQFVLKSFASSFHWQSVFFEHALSKPWLLFTIENNFFEILEDDYQLRSDDKESIQPFHIDKARNTVAGFLKRFIIGQNDADAWQVLSKIKNELFVRNALFSVKDWSGTLSYQIFEGINDFEEKDAFAYYHILDNIAKINPGYVLAKLDEILPLHFKKSSSERDYQESEALKTLAKDVPERLFPILYKAIKLDFDRYAKYIDADEDELIHNYSYSSVDLRDTEDHYYGSEFIYQLLGACLKKCAHDHRNEFLLFFDEHKNSRYEAILRLLLFALEDNEKEYADQVFDLFCIFEKLDLLTYGDGIQNDLRRLLEKTFPEFSWQQKQLVIQVIRTYTNKKEIYYRKIVGEEKACRVSNWGLSKLLMIKRLPQEVIETEFKREFRELVERFKDLDTTDPRKVRNGLAGIVHSPIPNDVCHKMGVKHWLRAFRTYDRDVNRWGKDFLKGSLQELANAFQSTVAQYPNNDKLQIIEDVLNDDKLPIKYAVYGLWGWLEGKGDKSLIVPLVKKMLTKDRKDENRMRISIVSRMIGNKKDEAEFINVLVSAALDFSKGNEDIYYTEEGAETSINGLITKAINTDYGAAIKALTRVVDPEFEDLVFETMETVFENGPRESRAAAFFEFAYLLNRNKSRAFKTFSNWLAKEEDLYVIASSIWSFQYMRGKGNFSEIKTSYERLLLPNLLGHDDAYMLYMVFYAAYLNNENEADGMLYSILELNNDIWRVALNQVFENYYAIDDSKVKNNKLLNFLLDKATDDDVEELNWSLAHLDKIKLEDIDPFLRRFLNSRFFRMSDDFLDYLIMQIVHAPYKAIELFELALKNKHETDDRFAWKTEEKSIKFIVNSYNGLSQNTNEAKMARQKVLLMFDTLLQNYRYRTNSDKILEELI